MENLNGYQSSNEIWLTQRAKRTGITAEIFKSLNSMIPTQGRNPCQTFAAFLGSYMGVRAPHPVFFLGLISAPGLGFESDSAGDRHPPVGLKQENSCEKTEGTASAEKTSETEADAKTETFAGTENRQARCGQSRGSSFTIDPESLLPTQKVTGVVELSTSTRRTLVERGSRYSVISPDFEFSRTMRSDAMPPSHASSFLSRTTS